MHATTGSLGQGLSIAIGHAMAMKLKDLDKKCFCILGDGEMQEGQVWEALMLAPKYGLDNLICIIDSNKSQNDGEVKDILSLDPLDKKIEAFGWDLREIDGHNMEEIHNSIEYFSKNTNGVPKCIIMNTIKGFGVSFMQKGEWHAKAPNKEQYEAAILELGC